MKNLKVFFKHMGCNLKIMVDFQKTLSILNFVNPLDMFHIT